MAVYFADTGSADCGSQDPNSIPQAAREPLAQMNAVVRTQVVRIL